MPATFRVTRPHPRSRIPTIAFVIMTTPKQLPITSGLLLAGLTQNAILRRHSYDGGAGDAAAAERVGAAPPHAIAARRCDRPGAIPTVLDLDIALMRPSVALRLEMRTTILNTSPLAKGGCNCAHRARQK